MTLQTLAQTGLSLFIEHRDRATRPFVENNEAQGIRANIDHRHTPGLCRPGSGGGFAKRCCHYYAFGKSSFEIFFCFFSADPRPDRLGFVMK